MAEAITGFQQITSLSSAVGLTVPAGTRKAIVQADTKNVRMRSDGTDPTTSVGMLLVAGAYPLYEIFGAELSAAKFIEVEASAKLNVTYYGHVEPELS